MIFTTTPLDTISGVVADARLAYTSGRTRPREWRVAKRPREGCWRRSQTPTPSWAQLAACPQFPLSNGENPNGAEARGGGPSERRRP